MRAGRIRAGRDNGKIDLLVAFGQEPVSYLDRDVTLAPPDQGDLSRQQRVRHAVGRGRRRGQCVYLGLVLNRPQGGGHL